MLKHKLTIFLVCSLTAINAQANIKCINDRTNVIVEVGGYGAICPRGYSTYRGGSSSSGGLLNRIGAFDHYKTQPGETMSPFMKQTMPFINGLAGANKQSVKQTNGAVQAKLQQIKEIDALYKSGSISKAQADSLKRSVLGN